MNLWDESFQKIKDQTKTIEMRLCDEKRSLISVGDIIEFTNTKNNEILECTVTNLYKYKNFDELYKHHNKISIGYSENEIANSADMLAYYSAEKIEKYGALGIEIRIKYSESICDPKLRLSAYNGNSNAQYDIAKYYETVDIDIEQSNFWYRKAALQGYDLAIKKCLELGIDRNAPIIDKESIRKELQCRLYPLGYLEKYKYTVICTAYQGKWILSRHKKRDTWETQGGHIEDGESPIECARRELFEESGIKDADIYPVCDYWGFNRQACSNGVVFLAVVHSLGELPESEMKEIKMFDTLPDKLTYPNTSPKLYLESDKLLRTLNFCIGKPDTKAAEELSAMAVVLCDKEILATNELIYGKEVLSLPKGHKEENESLIDTAIRECFEETNIVISKTDFIKELKSFSYEFLTPSNKPIRKTVVPFLFKVNDKGSPLAKEKRMISVSWMNKEEFLDNCTHENVKKVVREI